MPHTVLFYAVVVESNVVLKHILTRDLKQGTVRLCLHIYFIASIHLSSFFFAFVVRRSVLYRSVTYYKCELLICNVHS